MSKRKLTVLAATIAASAAVFGLTACGEQTPAAPTTVQASPDDDYLGSLKEAGLPVDNAEVRSSAIKLGHVACDTLDSGVSVETALATLLDNRGSVTPKQEGTILGSAIRVYCPKYIPAAEAAASTGGA